jgi:tRNA U34 5-carboxymethylaminomethyl modifying enzyme MnmG/GidA
MGFLVNLFKSKELRYLESFVSELKQDKTFLQKEVLDLKQEIKVLKEDYININNILNTKFSGNNNNKIIKNIKLTKLETKIYNSYIKNKPASMVELSIITGVKVNSLRVYCSKLNKKLVADDKQIISFRPVHF